MEIFINNQKIEFELENEKNAFDIITAIADYSSKLNPPQFICAIFINNKEYSYADDEKLKSIKTENIETLKVEVSDVHEITLLSIEQMKKFLSLLKEIILNKKKDELTQIFKADDSINWLVSGIEQIYQIYDSKGNFILDKKNNFKTICNSLNSLLKNLNIESGEENTVKICLSNIEELLKIIEEIKIWLITTFRIPDRNYIIKCINELVEEIGELIPKLEGVSLLYQTGEDKETMNIIQKMTSILERSTNLFIVFKESFKIHLNKYKIKEVDFETYFKNITENLKMLIEAIQNQDFVMISDLLEYEFIPNIEEIKKMLIKIKKEAFTKAN